MFVCDPCYKKENRFSWSPWETSHGPCEVCGKIGACHDVRVVPKEEPPAEAGTDAPKPEADWQGFDTAPAEGIFLVYLERTLAGSRVQVMNRRSGLSIIGSSFAFDCPKPIFWKPVEPPAGWVLK